MFKLPTARALVLVIIFAFATGAYADEATSGSSAGSPAGAASGAQSTPVNPSPCTLYGYLHVGNSATHPLPATKVRCNPPNQLFDINDSTGFYSCTHSVEANVKITLSGQPGNAGTSCHCTAPSKQCDWQF